MLTTAASWVVIRATPLGQSTSTESTSGNRDNKRFTAATHEAQFIPSIFNWVVRMGTSLLAG
ncbi:MAG: hypothetical protein Q8Q73_07970 [Stagnimonas sp.]|nr:hypothetical protein [Stagnimonas sp.]